MKQPITPVDLRAPGGWRVNKVSKLYLPTITEEGDFSLPPRDSSILNIRVKGKTPGLTKSNKKFLNPEQRLALSRELATNLGLRLSVAELFVSRPISSIERAEEEIRGIVDSLLLFDTSIFLKENQESKGLLLTLLRKIISVGCFDIDGVTKMWKLFSNFVWVKASRSKTMEEPTLGHNNIFKRLLKWRSIEELLLNGITDKRQAEALAHLTSSRQLVAGGLNTMKTAMRKFIETTSVTFNVSEEECKRVRLAAQFVGKRTKTSGFVEPTDSAHISLSGAGSFETPVKDGGRATDIIEDINRILAVTPEEDCNYVLPMGFRVQDKAGLPRWTTWCRDEPLEPPEGALFGHLRQDMTLAGEYDRRWGYDDALGNQIFICALLTGYQEGYIDDAGEVLKPIPARSLPVPEPGGKCRIVTTTTWWNAVLQQPAGHYARRCLEFHASAEAGLQRADQAWLYLEQISKTQPIEDYWVLSSDLEEATDATPTVLIKELIEGFMEGLGVTPDPLLRLGLNLAKSERLVFTSDTVFVKKRGCMMGEPLTKAVLTLLNLSCEELAIRDYLGSQGILNSIEIENGRLEGVTPFNSVELVLHRYNLDDPTVCVEVDIDYRGSYCSERLLVTKDTLVPTIAKLLLKKGGGSLSRAVLRRRKDRRFRPFVITNELIRSLSQIEFVYGNTIIVFYHGRASCIRGTTFSGPVQVTWRAFAVGGDDHIAIGPLDYLQLITDNHILWGSKISKSKHAVSQTSVKYCEKILLLKGRDLNIQPRAINRSTEMYEKSIFVDSIKVRLLSPISKSIEVQNDRNIAIGKAKSLGRTLRWLNPDIFKYKWILMVRTRFIRRMKHYLPKEGTSLFNQILLPEELGGLDLYLKGEIPKVYTKVPIPTKQFICNLLRGTADFRTLRTFKTFTSNGIERGFGFKANYIESLELHGPGIDGENIYDVRDRLGISTDLSLRKLLSVMSHKGWLTFDDLLRKSLRGVLFEEILSGGAELKKFSTTPWKKRYSQLWDATYDPEFVLDEDPIIPRLGELENIARFLPLRVYDVLQEVPSLVHFSWGSCVMARPFIEDIMAELPNLKLKLGFGTMPALSAVIDSPS